MEYNISQRQNQIKTAIITATIVFIGIFFTTIAFMNMVYGVEMPSSYNETIQVTKNATENTQGYMINSYVENVKEDICKVLVNATEYQECMAI